MTKVEGGPLRFRVKYDEAHPLKAWGSGTLPLPHVELDPNFNKTVEYYEGKVVHQRAFKIKAGEAGEGSQEVAVKGQFCDEHQCHYIREKTFGAAHHRSRRRSGGSQRSSRTGRRSLPTRSPRSRRRWLG